MGSYTTLVELLDQSLRKFAPHPIFGTKTEGTYRWITYADFGAQVDKARGALALAGLMPGERVAIISANRVEWAILAYATYQLGGVLVPMYESQSPTDWHYIIRDSEPAVLAVADGRILARLQPLLQDLPSIRHLVQFSGGGAETAAFSDWLAGTASAPSRPVTPQQLAGLIYTSGTTGKPKGVMLSHHNIASNVGVVGDLFPIGPGDVSLSFLPWAHAFGQIAELNALISLGAASGLAERVDSILENLTEVRPTILVSVPRIFNRIYEGLQLRMAEEKGFKKRLFYAGLANTARLREREAKHRSVTWARATNRIYDKLVFSKVKARFGGRLKYAFSGGAALAPGVARFMDQLNILVFEGYGLTETSPIISANSPGHRKIGSVGLPIQGVRVAIDQSKGTAPGQGEIINYGPNSMLGYYHLPKETAATLMPDGGVRTGDLGYVDDDGFLYVTGRLKDLFKLENGKYVAPAPLEEELQLSPYILQAMLYGDNLPSTTALVVPEQAGLERFYKENGLAAGPLEDMIKHPEVQALLEREVAKLAAGWRSYERPRRVIAVADEWTVDNNLLTPTLKVKRNNVTAKYLSLLTATATARSLEEMMVERPATPPPGGGEQQPSREP